MISNARKPVTRIVRRRKYNVKKVCLLSKKGHFYIDYKDINLLKRYLKNNNKITSRKTTGNSQGHQRRISNAIKRARIVGLLPFVAE